VTFNALLDLHQFNAPKALQLLDEAAAARVAVCTRTYAKAARTLWWAKRPEEAWQLRTRMEQSGVSPDSRFYTVSIAAAESVGMLDEADRLHREALAAGLNVRVPRRDSAAVRDQTDRARAAASSAQLDVRRAELAAASPSPASTKLDMRRTDRPVARRAARSEGAGRQDESSQDELSQDESSRAKSSRAKSRRRGRWEATESH